MQANAVDQLANRYMSEGRLAEFEQALTSIDRSALSAPERETWWHLYGIEAFRTERDAEALRRFEEGLQHFPDSQPIRFSLGQQCIRLGQVDRAFELFKQCQFPDVSREFLLAQCRYAYLWDRYADGLTMLRPLLKAFMT